LRVQSAMPVPVPVSPAEAAAAVLISRAADLHRASGGDLAGCFAAVPDPRRRRGIRHPLPVIPGLAVAAGLAAELLSERGQAHRSCSLV
jgi:hypothetical protein